MLNSTLLPQHNGGAQTICGQQISQKFHLPRTSGLHSGTQPRLCRRIIVHCPFHCETVHHRLFYGQALSLFTFDAIVFSDACHPSEAVSALTNVAAAHHGWTANVFELRIWTALCRHFSKSKKGIKIPSLLKEKSEGSMRKIFKFLKIFLAWIGFMLFSG